MIMTQKKNRIYFRWINFCKMFGETEAIFVFFPHL